ncbi:hypothetical protein HanRHA438_Chr08g0368801 [Helianthus annuus]|nr:hypothetical protein HanRHA438_Chr08g0368801 [Helianthus annuus]
MNQFPIFFYYEILHLNSARTHGNLDKSYFTYLFFLTHPLLYNTIRHKLPKQSYVHLQKDKV